MSILNAAILKQVTKYFRYQMSLDNVFHFSCVKSNLHSTLYIVQVGFHTI